MNNVMGTSRPLTMLLKCLFLALAIFYRVDMLDLHYSVQYFLISCEVFLNLTQGLFRIVLLNVQTMEGFCGFLFVCFCIDV